MDVQKAGLSAVKVTEQMINHMRSTKLWTKFLSIMGFIMAGFMVIMGVFIIFAGNLFAKGANPNLTIFMGIFYVLCSIFYIIPSLYLFKFASALNRFLSDRKDAEMEAAISYQKSFWKFCGILCLIGMIIAIVGIVAAIAIPMLLGTGMKTAG